MPEARVGLGFTLNLGNYQSAKAQVELMDEGRPGETVEDVHERVMVLAEDALVDAIAEVVARLEAEGWAPKVT